MRILRTRSRPLPLTNKGSLTVFPVGCGSAFAKKLYQNNILIIKGDTHVMVDCGTRTPQALADLGHSVTDITTWLITHSHADHIGGLEEVILMGRYMARKKPTVIITTEYQDLLWEHSLKGGNGYNERRDGRLLEFEDYWDVIRPKPRADLPRDTREARIGELNLKLVRTRHVPEQAETWQDAAYSVGLIIDDRVLFTGDTQFDPELITVYDRVFHFELIYHDVQFFTGGVHAGLEEVSTLPEEIKRRTLLMHYPDSWKSKQKDVKAAGFLGFSPQQRLHIFD